MRLSIGAIIVCASLIGFSLAVRADEKPEPHGAAEWMAAGQADLDRFFFVDAEAAFRRAIALDADSAKAHILLARALIGQLSPNLMLFPDTGGLLPKAEKEADRAVELSPEDANALCVQGIVRYKSGLTIRDPKRKSQNLTDAMHSFDRALTIDPTSLEAHYELARMFLEQTFIGLTQARSQAGMKFGQGGPISDVASRHLMRDRYSPSIDLGLTHARKALEINPRFEPAMSQVSLGLMLRATLRDELADYSSDMKEASELQQKAAEIRTSKPPLAPPPNPEQVRALGILGGVIGSIPAGAVAPQESKH
jgi:tetratricopeptide (TPR) repeat protein